MGSTTPISGGRPTPRQANQLCLIAGFQLRSGGETIYLPRSGQRLLAFLALHDRPLLRSHISGSLWIDSCEARSNASLRSVLWRMRESGLDVIASSGDHLGIAADVAVDLRDGLRDAQTLVYGDERGGSIPELGRLGSFLGDLLPDWSEDWLVGWQEQWRQVRLHALEVVADRLLSFGRFGAALDTALSAVRTEPLRESAHRCVIRIHLAEGNYIEARRQFDAYRRLAQLELGVEPSRLMWDLLHHGCPSPVERYGG